MGFFIEWKIAEGLAELRHAERLAPNNATNDELLGRVLRYVGQINDAERVARHSIEIDQISSE